MQMKSFLSDTIDVVQAKLIPKEHFKKILDRGVASPEILAAIEYAGVDLEKWLFGFDDICDSTQANVDLVRNHPLIPKRCSCTWFSY